MKFTEGQNLAFDAICNSGQNVLVIGKAGTGKSTLLQTVRTAYGHETVFCATTGVANQQLFDNTGGSGTINRVLSLPTVMHNEEHVKSLNRYTSSLFLSSDAVRRIVPDEMGMANSDQLDLINKRLQRFNRPGKKREARNIQLCGVADLLQIPPVINEYDKAAMKKLYGSHLFFKSKLFEEMDFKVVYMNEVVRTPDPEFSEHLDVIRYGEESQYKDTLAYFNQRHIKAPSNIPVLSPYNRVVDHVNYQALVDNPNPCGLYKASFDGKYDIKSCPVEPELRLKEGLPVITLVNHADGIYQNGSSGIVEQMSSEGVYVKFNATGEVHLVEPHKFKQMESYVAGIEITPDGHEREVIKQRDVGEASCVPIKLAAAMTGHRAQGRTLDSPTMIDLGFSFRRGDFGIALAYVMLSRFTGLDLIYLKNKLTPKHIKVCRETIEWMQGKNFI